MHASEPMFIIGARPAHIGPLKACFRTIHADTLRYRCVNLENFQLQLCEPPEGDTPQRRFLETHGEGVFHLGFTVPNCGALQCQYAALNFSFPT